MSGAVPDVLAYGDTLRFAEIRHEVPIPIPDGGFFKIDSGSKGPVVVNPSDQTITVNPNGPAPDPIQFTVTGVMSLISFAIVLSVGFYKHWLRFFSLFWPKNTPIFLAAPISLIEFVSFLVRPFSLGLPATGIPVQLAQSQR